MENQQLAEKRNLLSITPLGAGQEVGRSCIILEFVGKKIMMDCGICPGFSGLNTLPFINLIDASKIDLVLITHFHLDHCGALPWFLQKTNFKGRCFMTHATKAIYKFVILDYIRINRVGTKRLLYDEADLEASMDKIETIDFHEDKDVFGIKFFTYHAGHVLGAAMFMIEIAGVNVSYTGDFHRQEGKHLMAAEIPNVHPDVLITESTHGIEILENNEDREKRFTKAVHQIVSRALAKNCMEVYKSYTHVMNAKIRKQVAIKNPFVFKHISYLKGKYHLDDAGPCVVLASPGMMQSGLCPQKMRILKTALQHQYHDDTNTTIGIHNPRNGATLKLNFKTLF
ncbi:hypothetical protein PV327_001549 [Microctonus hyperodae]|uniref:Metallo-beta-lactamase domain-containing protein n=1 Tax=Microctonus hyperodae TaxID=165561 RepID=A0AA39G8F7_MICHY|nr:hypothetical protein PV327_001549 [Microctonus hyperodae]